MFPPSSQLAWDNNNRMILSDQVLVTFKWHYTELCMWHKCACAFIWCLRMYSMFSHIQWTCGREAYLSTISITQTVQMLQDNYTISKQLHRILFLITIIYYTIILYTIYYFDYYLFQVSPQKGKPLSVMQVPHYSASTNVHFYFPTMNVVFLYSY